MANPITVGFSGLTKRIFAGRSKASKLAPGVRQFTGEKFDVTDEAVYAVAHLMVARDDILIIPMANGDTIHLRADIKEKRNRGGIMTVTHLNTLYRVTPLAGDIWMLTDVDKPRNKIKLTRRQMQIAGFGQITEMKA